MKRSHEEIEESMLKAFREGKEDFGFLNVSPLYGLRYYNLLWGFCLDSLHAIDHGAFGRTIFDCWFDDAKAPYYIGSPAKVKFLNARLSQLKFPKELHRLSRPIEDRAKWRASELKNFILYFGVPCLINILPERYLDHFSLLVEGVTLLYKEVTDETLRKSRRLLTKFYSQVKGLYGAEAETYNMHLIPHFPDYVEQLGPVWTFTTFPFEGNMKNIKNCVKGSSGVAIQISEKMAKHESLPLLEKVVQPSLRCKILLKRLNPGIPRAKRVVQVGELTVFGRPKRLQTEHSLLLPNGSYQEYDKIIFRSILYTSSEYRCNVKSKRDNSIIKLNSNAFGRIKKFFFNGTDCFILMEKFMVMEIEGLSNIVRVDAGCNNPKVLIEPGDISGKCMLCKITRTLHFLSTVINNSEIQ